MEAAGELARIAAIGAANLHAAVTTGVQKCANRSVTAAANEDRILAHISCHIIAGFGYLRFVAEKQPAPREDALQLDLVDLRVEENLAADEPVFEFDVSL